ncbi:hypothetical protein [Methylobacterium sp. UNC300MFChir4.1]|uniref:hypothetical protein n=1 Tax=Methylobacterium sp. UNC300MFChir4.1 TaxID=1502747 RepID=UPI00111410A6|nr:hypothetical protein [Methylobacterium sp. UNC300MFChir4.1]
MLWGFSLGFWQTVVFWLWFVTASAGALAVAASFGSSVISYYISDATETAAKIEISKAKSDAGAANRAAGEANERAGKANERAAEALARAEHEALERARLEAQFAWRRIGQAAGKKAIDALSKNPGSINIVVINGDPEVSFYAHQIVGIFEVARWEVNTSFHIIGGFIPFQAAIRPSRNPREYEALNALHDAGVLFLLQDFPLGAAYTGNMKSDADVDFFVGSKISMGPQPR